MMCMFDTSDITYYFYAMLQIASHSDIDRKLCWARWNWFEAQSLMI